MTFETMRIGDVIDEIAMGPFGSNIKVECFVPSGVPVLNGSNLTGFTLTEESFNYVTPEKAASLKRAVASRGDVVITHRGTLGQIVYIPADSKHEKYVISQSQFRVRCRESVMLPEFMVYFFHSREGQHELLSNSSQVGVPALARPSSTFQELEMPVPTIQEQREIVDTLSALDDKIANNTKIDHHLEQMAQAIFKSWFVDFEPFGGEQPTTWITGKAEDFFDIAIGKTPPRKEPEWFTTNPQDVVWVSISDMGSCGMFVSDSSEYLTAESVERFNVKIVPSGSVLLSFKLTVGRVAITDGEMATNEAIAHFRKASDVTLEYLYCYLKTFDYQSLGNTSSIATAVNSKTIKAMPFVMPDEKVLTDFHVVTAPLFEQVRTKLAENTRLASLRDTLLPRLMSGEISVTNDERNNG